MNFSLIIINKCVTGFHKLSWWEVISINRVRLMAVLKRLVTIKVLKEEEKGNAIMGS